MDEDAPKGEAALALSMTTVLMLETKGLFSRVDVLSVFAQASGVCSDAASKAVLDRALSGLVRVDAGGTKAKAALDPPK